MDSFSAHLPSDSRLVSSLLVWVKGKLGLLAQRLVEAGEVEMSFDARYWMDEIDALVAVDVLQKEGA